MLSTCAALSQHRDFTQGLTLLPLCVATIPFTGDHPVVGDLSLDWKLSANAPSGYHHSDVLFIWFQTAMIFTGWLFYILSNYSSMVPVTRPSSIFICQSFTLVSFQDLVVTDIMFPFHTCSFTHAKRPFIHWTWPLYITSIFIEVSMQLPLPLYSVRMSNDQITGCQAWDTAVGPTHFFWRQPIISCDNRSSLVFLQITSSYPVNFW